MRDSLFGPDSITWRVNQEPVLLLGGGRALLMQLAHPGVAAGVAEHSDFRERPLQRLVRTLELTLALTFGDRAEALAAARQINVVHRQVRGEGYSALDQRLLLWVQATLIDSALATYSAFVGPLPERERDAYYQEAKLMGGLLGLARASYPPAYADFEAYVVRMLAGDELVVDAQALRLADAVLRPPLRWVPRTAYRPLSAVTAGLLPPRLRQAYRLPWGPLERAMFGVAQRGLPPLVAALPRRLRQVPPARNAARGRPRGPAAGPARSRTLGDRVDRRDPGD